MHVKYWAKRMLLVICTAVISGVALAQLSPEEILAQAQGRADQIAEYRALLNNPDQNVRVAALDVMLKSNDPAMREIAFNLAFSSADDAMRAIALRNKMHYLKTLNFDLSVMENATENEVEVASERFANSYPLLIEGLDDSTGSISFSDSRITGQINGIGMEFFHGGSGRTCSGELTLADGTAELSGTLNCSATSLKGNYNLKLRLQ